MSPPITLLFGVHAHQPVGNFPAVIEQAHRHCYQPFLETLHAYPAFRFSVHFSGWLLDELRARFPAELQLLAAMVRRGQVELFSSGDTEPVLAAIPDRDRVGQLRTLNDKLQQWTGARPTGAWLTERVWESSVVPALAETGLRYAVVDDYHFLCAGRSTPELDGYYSTEEGGVRLDLFPISERLRYRMPFSPAAEVIAHLEGLADGGQVAAIYFDDIEKFGVWPETHDWVYGRGWLKELIEGVLRSPRIRTATYADFHAAHATRGIVYLPNVSYREMNAWTLPMPAAGVYARLLAADPDNAREGPYAPFVRGGIWRNFLSRYPEGNWMHKRMQQLSARLARLAQPPPALRDHLYRAQANDAYWHGLFGGIYLPHLRRTVWNNLLALEAGLDALQPRPAVVAEDLDLDGKLELLLHTGQLQLALRDDGLGAAHELSSYALRHNFGDTLRRSREPYHDGMEPADPAHAGAGIASAHNLVRFKHPVTAADVTPDAHPRVSWLDALADQPMSDYARAEAEHPCFQRPGVRKTYLLAQDAVSVRWQFAGLAGQRFSTSCNLALPSCEGALGRYVALDGATLGSFGEEVTLSDSLGLTLEDGLLGGRVRLRVAQPAAIRGRPYRTVSRSEAGFEKIMQGAEITFSWLLPTDDCELRLVFAVEVTQG